MQPKIRQIDPRLLKTGGGLVDLFGLFPELPRPPRPPVLEQQRRVLRDIVRMHARARLNLERQLSGAARVKTQWLEQRRRHFESREAGRL